MCAALLAYIAALKRMWIWMHSHSCICATLRIQHSQQSIKIVCLCTDFVVTSFACIEQFWMNLISMFLSRVCAEHQQQTHSVFMNSQRAAGRDEQQHRANEETVEKKDSFVPHFTYIYSSHWDFPRIFCSHHHSGASCKRFTVFTYMSNNSNGLGFLPALTNVWPISVRNRYEYCCSSTFRFGFRWFNGAKRCFDLNIKQDKRTILIEKYFCHCQHNFDCFCLFRVFFCRCRWHTCASLNGS